MIRNGAKYVATKRGPQNKWSADSMQQAIAALKSGEVTSFREAQTRFNVPRNTLIRRYRGQVDEKAPAHKPTVLTEDEEGRIAEWLVECEEKLFGITPTQVCEVAYNIAEKSGRPHPFNKTTKKAGYDWLKTFQGRYSHLSIRKPEALSAARARAMNEIVVGRYFDLLDQTMDRLDLKNKPAQIYNCDETGLSSVHKPPRIMATKGKKQVHSKTSGERGFNTTVMACPNAVGNYIPPFVIFKGSRLSPALTCNAPPGTLFATSDTSYMNMDLFYNWIQFFVKHIPPARPVLLIVDGHGSHISIGTLEYAKENQVELLCLPPHTTHWLQPLDRTVYGPLKVNYDKACAQYMRENPGQIVTRYKFSGLFRQAYGKAATIANAISGFRSTGIYPFNPTAVPQKSFAPSKAWAPAPALAVEENIPSTQNEPGQSVSSLNVPVADPKPISAPLRGTSPVPTNPTQSTHSDLEDQHQQPARAPQPPSVHMPSTSSTHRALATQEPGNDWLADLLQVPTAIVTRGNRKRQTTT
ncbi:uncharacterized protein LOC762421 [Strongylocentrotus purpuratus]|uniref:HTH CENPB-type domain-containing protein n=1 Tax=Strongylocentrotus purpuratus TaxID=7668 RepID=A0A7M7NPQ0_STRPU|nr:uncharacterized protein LOC762421 [Strongylocentrotus purpuratus]